MASSFASSTLFISNRKKQNTLKKEQRIEQEKFDKKYNQQDDIVQAIQTKIDEFNKDVETFNQFKTSDTFLFFCLW
jgi:predicted nuclease with TOPRIM domain